MSCTAIVTTVGMWVWFYLHKIEKMVVNFVGCNGFKNKFFYNRCKLPTFLWVCLIYYIMALLVWSCLTAFFCYNYGKGYVQKESLMKNFTTIKLKINWVKKMSEDGTAYT